MHMARLKLAALALAGGVSLAGCATGYGYGEYGYGYGPYYGGYAYPYGYDYGYGGYYDPFGWYGDFYYPGVGIYVYDRDHHRHEWNDDQRRYWENRRSTWQSRTGRTWSGSENWSGWHHHDSSTSTTTTNPPSHHWNRPH
jgi:hypothetical protein